MRSCPDTDIDPHFSSFLKDNLVMGITMTIPVLLFIQVSLLYRPTALGEKLSSFAL